MPNQVRRHPLSFGVTPKDAGAPDVRLRRIFACFALRITDEYIPRMVIRMKPYNLLAVASVLFACGGPKGPTGAEKAAAYHAEEAQRAEAAENPQPRPEAETTLQFPPCQGKKAPPFPSDTEGAAFRAIVFLRITPEGGTAEHCYLAVEGDQRWEESALGDVSSWGYDPAHAGQPRERIVTYRLRE